MLEKCENFANHACICLADGDVEGALAGFEEYLSACRAVSQPVPDIELAICVCRYYLACTEGDNESVSKETYKLKSSLLSSLGKASNINVCDPLIENLDYESLAYLGGLVYQGCGCRLRHEAKGLFSHKDDALRDVEKARLEISCKMRDYMLLCLELARPGELDSDSRRVFCRQIADLDSHAIYSILCASGTYNVNGEQFLVDDKMAKIYKLLRRRNPRVKILLIIIWLCFACIMLIFLEEWL